MDNNLEGIDIYYNRNYRSTDTEDFIAMADRYFKDMNTRIKDFRDML